MQVKLIARPRRRDDCYPWRPMDNRERRAVWAKKYYQTYTPHCHPITTEKEDAE